MRTEAFICAVGCVLVLSHTFVYVYVCYSLLNFLNLPHTPLTRVVLQPSGNKQNKKIFFFRWINFYLSTEPISRTQNICSSPFSNQLRYSAKFLLFDDQKMFTLNRKLVNLFYCSIGFNVQFYSQWLIFDFYFFCFLFFHPGACFIIFAIRIISFEYINKCSENLLFPKRFFWLIFIQRSIISNNWKPAFYLLRICQHYNRYETTFNLQLLWLPFFFAHK